MSRKYDKEYKVQAVLLARKIGNILPANLTIIKSRRIQKFKIRS